MAARTLLEPVAGRAPRARPGGEPAPAPRGAVLAGPSWRSSSSRAVRDRRGRRCRCATPTTSPRSTSCSSASASSCSSGSTSRPRGAARGHAPAVAGGDGRVRRERWTPARGARGGHRAGRLLRHLHGVPQPQGDRPAAAARTTSSTASSPTSTAACSSATIPPPAAQRCSAPASRRTSSPPSTSPSSSSCRCRSRVALVFSRDLRAGLFYATAQSVNWVLGAGELLPAAVARADLLRAGARSPTSPHSEVTRLQDMLLDQRVEFLADPTTRDPAEHRGVRLAAHLDELDRRARGPPARARPAAEDRAVGLARA